MSSDCNGMNAFSLDSRERSLSLFFAISFICHFLFPMHEHSLSFLAHWKIGNSLQFVCTNTRHTNTGMQTCTITHTYTTWIMATESQHQWIMRWLPITLGVKNQQMKKKQQQQQRRRSAVCETFCSGVGCNDLWGSLLVNLSIFFHHRHS